MAWLIVLVVLVVVAVVGLYVGAVTGAVSVDLGIGRRTRTLGPQVVTIDASTERVFDIIAATYAERWPRAIADKVQILDRGSDMVLAAHRTPLRRGLVATTVETVRFTRPERIDFRLVRGPVPHVFERFELTGESGTTRLEYRGELGTDLWWLGAAWGAVVARSWERAVATSLELVQAEAERRARSR